MGPTSIAGNLTEGAVLSALVRTGKTILLPFGGGHRYDLAYEADGHLVKVQCKTARIRRGVLVFATASIDLLSQTRRSYRGEVDQFGVFAPATGKVYLIPVDAVGIAEASLRLEPTRNRQTKRIRWAHEFEIG